MGKTSIAAAFALLSAREGRRTLVCEVDAKGNLADVFGTSPLRFAPDRGPVEPGAMSMDTEESLQGVPQPPAARSPARPHRPSGEDFRLRGDRGAGRQGDPDGRKAVLRGARGQLRHGGRRRVGDGSRRRPARLAGRSERTGQGRPGSATDRLDARDAHRPRQTGVVVVATPEEMPVNETIDLLARLDSETDIDVAAVIAKQGAARTVRSGRGGAVRSAGRPPGPCRARGGDR